MPPHTSKEFDNFLAKQAKEKGIPPPIPKESKEKADNNIIKISSSSDGDVFGIRTFSIDSWESDEDDAFLAPAIPPENAVESQDVEEGSSYYEMPDAQQEPSELHQNQSSYYEEPTSWDAKATSLQHRTFYRMDMFKKSNTCQNMSPSSSSAALSSAIAPVYA